MFVCLLQELREFCEWFLVVLILSIVAFLNGNLNKTCVWTNIGKLECKECLVNSTVWNPHFLLVHFYAEVTNEKEKKIISCTLAG